MSISVIHRLMKVTISNSKMVIKALFFLKHWKFSFQIFRKQYVPSFSLISIFSLSLHSVFAHNTFVYSFLLLSHFSLSSLSPALYTFYFCSLLLKKRKTIIKLCNVYSKRWWDFRVFSIVHIRADEKAPIFKCLQFYSDISPVLPTNIIE